MCTVVLLCNIVPSLSWRNVPVYFVSFLCHYLTRRNVSLGTFRKGFSTTNSVSRLISFSLSTRRWTPSRKVRLPCRSRFQDSVFTTYTSSSSFFGHTDLVVLFLFHPPTLFFNYTKYILRRVLRTVNHLPSIYFPPVIIIVVTLIVLTKLSFYWPLFPPWEVLNPISLFWRTLPLNPTRRFLFWKGDKGSLWYFGERGVRTLTPTHSEDWTSLLGFGIWFSSHLSVFSLIFSK